MKPFLYQIATLFYERYGKEINTLAFVFPNRRAGIFFQKYLAELTEEPIFSPPVMTINDLMVDLSGKHLVDKINCLFILYNIYIKISKSSETFDEFFYWGELLLNDFDDVDKYMINAQALFTNVTDLREIENTFDFLTDDQVAAIRSFWQTFYPKKDASNQQQFLAVWQILYPLYEELRAVLTMSNQGYEGMLFREVVEKTQKEGDTFELPYKKVIFVGLNALSVAEEKFLKYLQSKELADFYWDYSCPFVMDKENKASFFMERNRKNFPSRYPLPEEELAEKQLPVIDVIGIPSGVGQAKEVHTLLSELEPEELTSEKAIHTAIVLPDENLLVPVLNSIPAAIRKINVTMGYPLAGTPVSTLMEYILNMQKNIRYINRIPAFYFRDVLPILNHRYVMSTDPKKIEALVKNITDYNKIYIPFEDLSQSPLLKILFTPVDNVEKFSSYLIRILQELNRLMGSSEEEEDADAPRRAQDLEQEFIFHYFATVNRMREVMQETGIRMQIDTYFRLLKRLTQTIKIPFHGEPLSGLQIMGVLETRALDFDRLIVLSMNEGVFPAKKTTNSFIPYHLRRGFGLPTYEHQDSIWAYHFYRLIHRAKHVSLLYDTRSNGLQTGEVSRFVYQLKYHYEVRINNKLLVYNVSSSKLPSLLVNKEETVQRKLEEFFNGGKRAISASAVNTYLDCPLKFYFSIVENVQEEDEVNETVENNVFGSILHKVLEEIYKPLKGRLIMGDVLNGIRKDTKYLTYLIEKAFATVFFKREEVRPLAGQNFLIAEIIRKYVEKLLFWDAKLTPFKFVESEKRISKLFTLSDGKEVQLKGFIDRIDDIGGTLRILDYKSGRGSSVFDSVENLFNKDLKERSKAVMQVFMYAWMYTEEGEGKPVLPGIYYMRSLFTETFDSRIYIKPQGGKREAIPDYALFRGTFEEALKHCLDEIFDKNIPFSQTSVEISCGYCQFKNLCGKG
ncbi:PD-(D/E)XK nuclease family protein [Parabacteroides pacaensis]|uniref:PD-(D/E)XK nuclease family protein n=1 Tax=Parabacteroides pacaensis TaxID=2086575 RepID=UPI000D0FEFFA|nr:PD-(D/E)XK nuclease family protein [Parabacteroides pacaensis]